MDASMFPLIDLAGAPYERGVAYGKAVPERILRSIDLYRGELARRGVNPVQIDQLARDFSPHVSAIDPAYLEEMQGIADGAAAKGAKFHGRPVDLLDVACLNTQMEYETLDNATDATPNGLERRNRSASSPSAKGETA